MQAALSKSAGMIAKALVEIAAKPMLFDLADDTLTTPSMAQAMAETTSPKASIAKAVGASLSTSPGGSPGGPSLVAGTSQASRRPQEPVGLARGRFAWP